MDLSCSLWTIKRRSQSSTRFSCSSLSTGTSSSAIEVARGINNDLSGNNRVVCAEDMGKTTTHADGGQNNVVVADGVYGGSQRDETREGDGMIAGQSEERQLPGPRTAPPLDRQRE